MPYFLLLKFGALGGKSYLCTDNYMKTYGSKEKIPDRRTELRETVIELLAKMPPVSISEITDVRCEASVFDQAFDSYASPLPILYQSGYLTIKDYNRHRDMYALGFPNEEVRKGFASCLFQYVTNTKSDNLARSVFLNAYYDFSDNDDLPAFIEAIRTFYAGIPYQLARDNRNEHYYHSLLTSPSGRPRVSNVYT